MSSPAEPSFAQGSGLLRWQRGEMPLVLGHRGARETVLENTLAAFEQARLEGAAGTELDVQLSRDGRAFVFHDHDLTRVSQGRRHENFAALTSTELARVALPGEHAIPPLGAVLDWAVDNDMLLNVELKSERAIGDHIADVTADELLRRPKAQPLVLVSSFHPLLLRRFKQRLPDVPTGLLMSARHRCLAQQHWASALGCAAVHPEANLLLAEPELVTSLGGLLVNTWTVNDETAALRLARAGVNALISDCPGRILAALGA